MNRYHILFIALLCAICLGAALTEKSLRGTGGVVVISNLNTHLVTVDGSGISGTGIPIQNGKGNATTLTNPLINIIKDFKGSNRIEFQDTALFISGTSGVKRISLEAGDIKLQDSSGNAAVDIGPDGNALFTRSNTFRQPLYVGDSGGGNQGTVLFWDNPSGLYLNPFWMNDSDIFIGGDSTHVQGNITLQASVVAVATNGGVGTAFTVDSPSTFGSTLTVNDKFIGNGSGITNLLHSATVSAGSGATVTTSKNADGSTNFAVAATGSGGSVTAVGLNTLPAQFGTNSGSVTTSGNLGFSNVFQSANTVMAGPTSGSVANPAYRALVNADVPALTATSQPGFIGSSNGLGTNTGFYSRIGQTVAALTVYDTNGNQELWSSTNFSGVTRFGTNANGYLSISNNASTTNTSFQSGGNAPSVYITEAGNVGISKAAPTVALDVTGAITASGAITAGGNVSIAAGNNLTYGSSRARMASPTDGVLAMVNNAQTAFTRLVFSTNSVAAGYSVMAPSITVSGPNLILTDQAGTLQSSNSLTVGISTNINGAVFGQNGSVITNVLKFSATLDFPSTAAGSVSDLPITATGASDGDVVQLGVPSASVGPLTGDFFAWASNAVVYVRFANNNLVSAQDPASGTFKVIVTKVQ